MGHLADLQTLPNYLPSSTKINPVDTREKQACHYKKFDDVVLVGKVMLSLEGYTSKSVNGQDYITWYLQQLGPTPSHFSLARQVRWEAPDNV